MPFRRAPCVDTLLRALATKGVEICGLAIEPRHRNVSSFGQTLGVYRHFFGQRRARTALMVLPMFLAAVMEGIGVIALVPLLELAEQPGGRSGGPLGDAGGVGSAIRGVIEAAGLEATLGVLLSLIVVAIVGKAILLLLADRQIAYTVAGVIRDLQLELMKGVLAARWSYFGSRGAGHFANAITLEARRAANAYREACAALANVLHLIAYTIVAILISWQLALGGVVIGLLLTAGAGRFFGESRRAGSEQTRSSRSLAARFVDVFQGIKPLKAMGRERLVWPLLEDEADAMNRARQREALASATLRAFQEPIAALLLAVGIFVALVYAGQPLPPTLVLGYIFYRLLGHVNTLQIRHQTMLVGESAFVSLRDDIAEANAEREVSGGEHVFPGLQTGIVVRDLSFSYADRVVFHNVNITIPAAAFVAIHGESGSGKTTFADLLVGLHTPSSGDIVIDGRPLPEWELASWRHAIGYVPQETLLFNASVLTNVTLDDPQCSRDDAERALRMAGAWDFVCSTDAKLDHPIGDRGARLSGGQRRRIALARALVRRPSLLILDEVTAGLDPKTEKAICETLKALGGEVTILAISHQPAMREVAGFVCEIVDGRLLEVDAATR